MSKSMTKSELVAALAEEIQSDKKTANAAVDALCALITREVSAGKDFTLPGVGKFSVRDRPARTVRNPSTREEIHKPADKAVKVTIAKALKDRVNT
ncbi:MAG: HU family DNA-binding protein [Rhodobacteraceae bacterium]|nr:HU family DNA-binding protein [Paracoccaceae bacterium]